MTAPLRAAWLALLIAAPAMAQDALAPAPSKPPMFDPRRYTEDYRYVLDPAKRTGAWWEPLKVVPIGDDVQLELGGEIRVRTESYAGNLFSRAPVATQTYVWDRALPYASLHVGTHVRAFVQFEAAYAQGERPSPTPLDETGIDLLQGFVEADVPVGDAHLTARVGRQVLTYGDGALIDSRYGPNVLQSFDGAFVDYRTAHHRFDLFWARPVVNGLRDFDDHTSGHQQIWGAIAGRDIAGLKGGVLDVYYFGFEDRHAMFNGKQGRELRHTIGLRHSGAVGALDWKADTIGQFGSFGDGRIRAYALGGELGYTLAHAPLTPRLHANSGVASGDDGRARGLGTFNALFPRGQYFSDTGLLGPYNLINLRTGSTFTFSRKVNLDALVGFYWRENPRDAVYRNGGALLFAASAGEGRYIATQYEAVLSYIPTRGIDTRLTLALFDPGPFVRSTGNVAPVRFVGAEARFWF